MPDNNIATGVPDDRANGVMLADVSRGTGKERLRVTLVDYRGALFVSIRTWSNVKGGPYRPTARGVHLRPSELRAVRDAIDTAIRLAAEAA